MKTKTAKITANGLTRQALITLNSAGYHVWRQNNGGVYDPKIKRFRANSSTPGISDIIGFHKKSGQFVAIEIKIGRDKLSPFQERFISDVLRAGGLARVIKTPDELEELHKELKPQKFSK